MKLSYHANVVEASREVIAALNRVKRFRYSWETGETVKVPDSYLQLISDFAEQRMARFKHIVGQSRQFTIEEIQAFSPFESNDVSVDELRASVNLEGEDPQEVLQYVNIIPLMELPEEQAALDEEMIEGATADVNVEPKVEETDEGAALPDSNMETDDSVPGLATTSAGVNALPPKPEQDQQAMEIEAQVLDVLADEAMANEGDEADAQMVPETSDDPITGQAPSSASRPPLPRLRGKGQGHETRGQRRFRPEVFRTGEGQTHS